MGILNCTPDSFYDGAEKSVAARVRRGLRLLADGAEIIDIGGESTRPGAAKVSAKAEIARVVPVIEALRRRTAAPISIDTYKASVAEAALRAGANIINDIFAGADRRMFAVAQKFSAPIILMHSQGEPRTMQLAPKYKNVAAEVTEFLWRRVAEARKFNLRVIVDPGFGFGKTTEHNWELFRALKSFCAEFHREKIPVLIGVSNKTMLGGAVAERREKSVAAALDAIKMGADIVRVHNVAETAILIQNSELRIKNFVRLIKK
jgi:dihydropteroate synthase